MALVRRPMRATAILAAILMTVTYLWVTAPPGGYYLAYARYGMPFRPSSFDWQRQFEPFHPVAPKDMAELPDPAKAYGRGGGSRRKRAFPPVQAAKFAKEKGRRRWYDPGGSTTPRGRELARRREQVKKVFLRCWRAYRERAWLRDELTPVTGAAKDPFGGWAATLVDSLDTLWIMGLRSEFDMAVRAVARHLDFGRTDATAINVFETTIRHLGGLLSAYDLSGEEVLLARAVELGDMLYAAFDTPNRIPGFWLDFDAAFMGTQMAGTHDPSAASTSLGLEFARLAQLTGVNKYYDAVDRIVRVLEKMQGDTRLRGMWPTFLNFRDEAANSHEEFTLGALADSLYEYLPKLAALLGDNGSVDDGKDEPDRLERMYRAAMDTAAKALVFRPMLPPEDAAEDVLFVGNAVATGPSSVHEGGGETWNLVPEGQHLSCFVGGMFALGGRLFAIPDHVEIGAKLARGCAWGYSKFPQRILPEIFNMVACGNGTEQTPTDWREPPCEWDQERWFAARKGANMDLLPKGFTNARDPRYLLRPEAAESLFVLWRVTGDERYIDKAWDMFQAIVKATETQYANAAIEDVTVTGPSTKIDSMEVSV